MIVNVIVSDLSVAPNKRTQRARQSQPKLGHSNGSAALAAIHQGTITSALTAISLTIGTPCFELGVGLLVFLLLFFLFGQRREINGRVGNATAERAPAEIKGGLREPQRRGGGATQSGHRQTLVARQAGTNGAGAHTIGCAASAAGASRTGTSNARANTGTAADTCTGARPGIRDRVGGSWRFRGRGANEAAVAEAAQRVCVAEQRTSREANRGAANVIGGDGRSGAVVTISLEHRSTTVAAVLQLLLFLFLQPLLLPLDARAQAALVARAEIVERRGVVQFGAATIQRNRACRVALDAAESALRSCEMSDNERQ